MDIFCKNEHKSCSKYTTDLQLGFKYIEIDKGVLFGVTDKKEKHLFFILDGDFKMRYNEFPYTEFHAGEMFFLPKSADCQGEALTKCSFIVHVYDEPVRLCDNGGLTSIINLKRGFQYEFKSLPICHTLNSYLQLFKSYIADGMDCCHLHEIKQKELFMIFRTYYSKKDLAQFFFPMLGKSLDFRDKVMKYYTDAKTAKELAGYCGYSEVYFSDLFVTEFKETPYKWMQKQKAKHIIGRLSQSNVSLKEIIDEFGFSSRCHFNKYCKSQFGDTAARVRIKLLSVNQ